MLGFIKKSVFCGINHNLGVGGEFYLPSSFSLNSLRLVKASTLEIYSIQ